jgi:hypothetical protein
VRIWEVADLGAWDGLVFDLALSWSFLVANGKWRETPGLIFKNLSFKKGTGPYLERERERERERDT